MKALEDDTDYKLKTLKDGEVDIANVAALKEKLKDRKQGNTFLNEFEESRKKTEMYVKALEREINKRRQVVDALSQGKKYYKSLLGEAEIVATVR